MTPYEQARIQSYESFRDAWPQTPLVSWLRFWAFGPWAIWG